MSVFVPRTVDTLVCSFGGAGTTLLLEFLANHRATNDPHDGDGLKHLPVPPVGLNRRIRCIYVFADPILAAVSLFNRGMQHAQSVKLLRHRHDLSPIPEGMALEAYARAGADRFHFEAHFENWHRQHVIHPTLFVRYETLWGNLDAIADFLELQPGTITGFPERQERASRPDSVDPQIREGLERMYGPFRDRLASQPETEAVGLAYAGRRRQLLRSRNLKLATRDWAGHAYRRRIRNPLSNALRHRLPGVHAAMARVKRRFRTE